jgi:ubiquinone/menaquinone biosynthesis C-methylase UbiE
MGLYADVVFPRVLEFLMSRPHMMQGRFRVLAEARGDVLEIGFGTGLNLPCYPRAVDKLTILDPANILRKKVAQRIAAAPMPIEKVHLDAKQLPFDAGRFDCVVSTWTLCTIPEVDSALREIRRVLKPGGTFLFLEHGRSNDERLASRQDKWNWLQQIIGVGCNLNRPIDRLVSDAGLELRALERFQMPKTPRVAAEHYLGKAVPA